MPDNIIFVEVIKTYFLLNWTAVLSHITTLN